MSLAAGTFVHPPVETQVNKPLLKPKVLILTKRNLESGGTEVDFKSGLNNSAQFLADMLNELGIPAKFEPVVDGNSIDREVYNYRPTHVVLEAIWVTPAKLLELHNLHPTVIFAVRVHSKITFLSYEGNAIEWIREFQEIPNVYIGFNSEETHKDFETILKDRVNVWLPNVYKKVDLEKQTFFSQLLDRLRKHPHHRGVLNVACFGAIRPMKDILLQAFAAMQYCNRKGLQLRFHITTGRVEQRGDSVLKNLRGLFNGMRHELVEHEWLDHDEFLELIRHIDLGMQVSLNESFNVVTADYIYNFKPIVVSSQIFWVADACKTDHKVQSIVEAIGRVIDDSSLLRENLHKLEHYNSVSAHVWVKFLTSTID